MWLFFAHWNGCNEVDLCSAFRWSFGVLGSSVASHSQLTNRDLGISNTTCEIIGFNSSGWWPVTNLYSWYVVIEKGDDKTFGVIVRIPEQLFIQHHQTSIPIVYALYAYIQIIHIESYNRLWALFAFSYPSFSLSPFTRSVVCPRWKALLGAHACLIKGARMPDTGCLDMF